MVRTPAGDLRCLSSILCSAIYFLSGLRQVLSLSLLQFSICKTGVVTHAIDTSLHSSEGMQSHEVLPALIFWDLLSLPQASHGAIISPNTAGCPALLAQTSPLRPVALIPLTLQQRQMMAQDAQYQQGRLSPPRPYSSLACTTLPLPYLF